MPVWATRDCQKRLEKEKKKGRGGERREKRKEQMNKDTCQWNEKAEMKVFQYKWKKDDVMLILIGRKTKVLWIS